ncbi:MFS transporter [Dictyobacter aurantiacus]|uniref:MFS transporter n=1 Tax=Dictyobacter aurantiacus TaxID=1936993 RepID=A0A401ZMQ7_9CHLR|nr:MFS transporter [Dictyobacter aurantiacus]
MLWIVSGANYLAYAATGLALTLFATHLTRVPLLVSGIAFVQILPAFVLGLPLGVLVDRYDRRLILIVTTALRVSAFALDACLASVDFVPLPLLYALALLLGVTETIEEPALAAALVMVVPREKLERANALLVGAQNIFGLLADPLGAFLVSISIVLSLGASSLCAGLALLALLCLRQTLRLPSRNGRERATRRGTLLRHIGMDIREGLRYLWHERLLLAIAVMAGIINACWSGYLVVMALYAVAPGPLGLSAATYGVLLMVISIGSILGTLLTAPVQRWLGRRWAIGFNVFGNGLMFVTPALTHNLWLIGAALLLGSMGGPMWTIAVAALQGRLIPAGLQGRVNATCRLLSIGMAALGPLAAGLLAQFCGLRTVLILFALVTGLQFIPFFRFVTEDAMMRGQ